MKEKVKILESFTALFVSFLMYLAKKRVVSPMPSNTHVRCTYEHDADQKLSWRLILEMQGRREAPAPAHQT